MMNEAHYWNSTTQKILQSNKSKQSTVRSPPQQNQPSSEPQNNFIKSYKSFILYSHNYKPSQIVNSMPLTSHNNILGWIHAFQIDENSMILGRSFQAQNPYPELIRHPNFSQCWKNWNLADTGMLIAGTLGGMLLAIPIATRSSHSILQRRVNFYRMSILSFSFAFVLAARNSWYRLTGLVPNGLEKVQKDPYKRIKYDYTSNFLNKSFLGYLINSQRPQDDQSK